MMYLCKSEENQSIGSKAFLLTDYDLEKVVKVTKDQTYHKHVKMSNLCKCEENPFNDSKYIPLTRL